MYNSHDSWNDIQPVKCSGSLKILETKFKGMHMWVGRLQDRQRCGLSVILLTHFSGRKYELGGRCFFISVETEAPIDWIITISQNAMNSSKIISERLPCYLLARSCPHGFERAFSECTPRCVTQFLSNQFLYVLKSLTRKIAHGHLWGIVT